MNTIDHDFKTIADHNDVQDLAQRQRIFEDVIIQRVKVIQEYVRKLSSKIHKQDTVEVDLSGVSD